MGALTAAGASQALSWWCLLVRLSVSLLHGIKIAEY